MLNVWGGRGLIFLISNISVSQKFYKILY